jgi:hypothetical protein
VIAGLQTALAGAKDERSSKAAATKARVEAGEGVPFFDERFSCREDDGVWSHYREVVQFARLRIFGEEGLDLAQLLSATLAARTANVTEILQCNIGVIAGYHLLARRNVAESDDWKAYRLLQLALIYVFTLRNALQIPSEAGHDWATRTDQIVDEIKLLRQRLTREQTRRAARLPEVSPSLRIPGLRVAIVSICAYPKDHPLVLRTLTPENRRLYAERHGYSLHVHMKHPLPEDGVHVQHAKLALVASYLRMGIYDWVAWFDCDSILMNLEKTLDSIIYRYARRRARPHHTDAAEPNDGDVDVVLNAAEEDFSAQHAADEPARDEELEAYVYHIGSCNTEEGCLASTQVRVNRKSHYKVRVETALVDMESDSEKLSSVVVGGKDLGECNPTPETDYDCGYHTCFREEEVAPETYSASGLLHLEVRSIKTSADCRCSRLRGGCYSAPMAAFEEATDGEKTTDPSYGMFVKFTLTPLTLPNEAAEKERGAGEAAVDPERRDELDPDMCCCAERPGTCANPRSLSALLGHAKASSLQSAHSAAPEGALSIRRLNSECRGPDVLLGLGVPLELCARLCREVDGCEIFIHGFGRKQGACYWELGDCNSFEQDVYTVYDIRDVSAATSIDCSQACSKPGKEVIAEEALSRTRLPAPGDLETVDDGVDLLITEEGWGLSSANWMIRSSSWSISFLERAFALCHREMPLFGDQDAMIHLLLNHRALRHDYEGDPLDPHAVIIPQRELNAYDALNAHYMGCDGYEDGDLLVTFPGCKEPQACNPLFELAAKHSVERSAQDSPRSAPQRAEGSVSMAHLRLFGPAETAAAVYEAARKRQ